MHQPAFDNSFYDQQTQGSLRSARVVLPILFEYYQPNSIVDIGCGRGAWLKAAGECGAKEVLGLDGDYVERGTLLVDKQYFQAVNLVERIEIPRQFDLAISLEVAEHLPFYRAETFVDDLVRLSDVVLFSAALPYQCGTEHINEQWLEFWAILFRRHCYIPCDLFRSRIWDKKEVESWYRQNVILFCKEAAARKLFPLAAVATDRPLSFVHPDIFVANITRYRPLSTQALDPELQDYQNILSAYLSGETNLPRLNILGATTKIDDAAVDLFPNARTQIVNVQTELAARNKVIQDQSTEIEMRLVHTRDLSAKLANEESESTRLRAELVEVRRRVTNLSSEIAARDTQIHDFSSRIANKEGENARLRSELLSQDHQIARQMEELLSGEERIRTLSIQLKEKEELLEKVLNSKGWRLLNRYRNIKNHFQVSSNAELATRAERQRLLLLCDEPDLRTTSKTSGIICIRGWAVSRSKIIKIRIFIDGTYHGDAFYGFVRHDIAKGYPKYKDPLHSGFSFRLSTSKLTPGIHSIKIIATASDRTSATLEGQIDVTHGEPKTSPEPSQENQSAPTAVKSVEKKNFFPGRRDLENGVDVSIVILARNEAHNLAHSLPLITDQKTSAKYEIIGIDTASEDGTAEIFKMHGARTFTIQQEDFHHFRTRLFGVEKSRGPLVVFLVGDALPANEYWLQALLRPFLNDDLVAATYSRQLPAPDCVPWEARDILRGCSVVREVKEVDWSNPIAIENYRKYIWKYISFSDVSSCYRKELLRAMPIHKYMSEVEDQYWCKCLLEEGYRIVLEPNSQVIHSHNDPLRRLYRRQVTYGRCFAAFNDLQPESMGRLLFHSLEDSANDFFFMMGGGNGTILSKPVRALQIPVMRFVKRLGFREGIRRGTPAKRARTLSRSLESTDANSLVDRGEGGFYSHPRKK